MKLNIGIDGNEANVAEKVGVSTYTYKLISEFKNIASSSISFNIFLKERPIKSLPKVKNFYKYTQVKGNFLWSQFFLPFKLLFSKDIDVFFSPAHYIPRFIRIPTVVTIHDLSYLYYPDDFLKRDLYKLRNWTKYSIKRAAKIIAVSEHTKKDILKFFNVSASKVEVVHNGFEKKQSIGSKNKNLLNRIIKNPYILYVGTLQPRKNISTLISSFHKFIKENPKYKLVITGKKGWLFEEIFQKVNNLGLKNKVIFTGYVDDSTLIDIYKSAFCLVQPSFYEGFGIPLLEAMSYGCPVISSDSSSLPEIAGNAALFFDPKNIDQLTLQLENLMKHEDLRNTLISNGYERIKLFSWRNCAKKTLKIIKELNHNEN